MLSSKKKISVCYKEKDIHYKKRDRLDHLNCITKLSDSILNYLFVSDTNIYNLASLVKIDMLIKLFDIIYIIKAIHFFYNWYHF